MARFEKISKFAAADIPLPIRKTKNSAGYDFVVAETTVVPSYGKLLEKMAEQVKEDYVYYLDAVAKITKELKAKPTLVPTGMKCYLDDNQYLELSVRSSSPLK
jgi:dUTP pyrophosphatase